MRVPFTARRLGVALASTLLAGGLAVTDGSVAPAAQAATPFQQTWSVAGGGAHNSSPVAADLSVGRVVLAADMLGRLRAVRPDGRVAWSVGVDPFPGRASAVESSPAVADLDRDGRLDVVVGAGAIDPRDRRDQGGVVAYNGDGSVKWRFRTRDTLNVYTGGPPDGLSDGVTTTPAIGDVDGDGIPDVVFGSLDHFVYALRGTDGRMLPGFPFDNGDTIFSSPALYDTDDDGRLEILIGGDATPNPPAGWSAKGTFRALDSTGSGVRQYWMRTFNDIVSGSPAVGDVNGDGRFEAVFTTGGFYNDTLDSRRVWAVHLDDGSTVPGWPQATDGLLFTSPVLGDVVPGDGGRPEIVVGDRSGALYAFRGNGTRAWKTFPGPRGNNGNGYDGGATIADLDGDGDQDVAIGYGNGGALLVDGASGRLIRNVGDIRQAVVGAPAVVDLGGTAGRQLVVHGWDPAASPQFSRGTITAVQLAASTAAPAWPVQRRSADRRGAPRSGGAPLPPGHCRRNSNPAPSPTAASGRGYTVLARGGGVFTFGTRFFGAPAGTRVPVPAQALAGRPQGDGYWAVGPTGAVQDFGSARWYGDARRLPLSAPVVDIAPTASGLGYWLVTADGGVFSYGDARFYGSIGSLRIPRPPSPVVGLTPTASGRGYWLVLQDGGVFTFGDAPFKGSTGSLRVSDPIAGLSASPDGRGYWMVARDGGVFSFGVPYHGSIAGIGLCAVPDVMVELLPTATGKGYWVIGARGGVFTFGDARFLGAPVQALGRDVVVDMIAVE